MITIDRSIPFDFKNMKVITIGSTEDLANREKLRRTTSPSPQLPNDVDFLNHDCPVCGNDTVTSSCSMTMLGFSSPEGHNHDDNCRKFSFTCPNGHEFQVRVQNTCPSCDWKGKEICQTCGDNVKVYTGSYPNQ